MSEVITREVTEDYVVYTMDDGKIGRAPREFIDKFGEVFQRLMATLEAEGHSADEAAVIVKQHVENVILRHGPEDAIA